MKKSFLRLAFIVCLCLVFVSISPKGYAADTIFGAAMDGQVDKVRAFLDQSAPVNAKDDKGHTLLMYAALFGRSAVVKLLIERGAAINPRDQDGESALTYAAKSGDPETVRLLLEKRPDLNARNNKVGLTALGFAEKSGSAEIVRLLKAAGARTSFTGQLMDELKDALLMNDVNRVRDLLDQGADIEAKYVLGWTALINSSGEGKADIVRLLLDRGADLNARGDQGETALWYAAIAGQANIVRLLLDKGADINAKDNSGLTSLGAAESQLKIAADRGFKEDIKKLEEVIRILKTAMQ